MRRYRLKPRAQIAWVMLWTVAALASCMEYRTDSGSLTAKSKEPVTGPNCASCHGYPLRDTNHVFHLLHTDSSITSDRPITCLNCHSRSMSSHLVHFADSIYLDSSGNEFHALDFPNDPELRTFPLVRVDSLIKPRPVPASPRPGKLPEIQEWVTALAHMNGVVDVDFDSTSVDTGRFHGARAEFNLEMQTCSSVDCHPNHGAYRWAAPSRGLSMLKGDTLPPDSLPPQARGFPQMKKPAPGGTGFNQRNFRSAQ